MEPMRAELQNNELKKKLFFKKKCMSSCSGIFGNIKWYNNCEVIKTVEICETGLFPPILYRITDDEFVGEYQGVKFRMSETKIPSKPFYRLYGNYSCI